jgi:hypothetical protein
MVPYVRETRKYEDDPHNGENRPAQPLRHRLFVWLGATHEGGIKCIRRESPYNGGDSDDYLKNPTRQKFLRFTKVYLTYVRNLGPG